MKRGYIRLGLLALVLFTLSFIYIALKGNVYIINVNLYDGIEQYEVEVGDSNIIEIVDEEIDNNSLTMKIKSLNKGKSSLSIYHNDDCIYLQIFYVHNLGIISSNEFLGDINGDNVILISMIIFLSATIYELVKKFLKCYRESMYQYKNILYLSTIILIIGLLLSQIFKIGSYNGISSLIDSIINTTHLVILVFPIAILVSILVILSNINLLRKEGFSFGNILGIILSIIVIVLTLFPDTLYKLLYNYDIHDMKSIYTYIEMLAEEIIYVVIAYLECILFSTILLGIKASKHIPMFDKDYIIILGCMIRKDGTLTPLLKSRVDRAIEFSKLQKEATGKDIVFIPSGGQGPDEIISEAEAMKNYLVENGIDEKKIIVEDKSKNTYENIKFSNKLILENKKVAYSTTNYHVFRAGVIGNLQGINMEGIGAKTKAYFWINAFIREFIATLYSERKRHFLIIMVIIVILILIVGLKYITNII